MDTKQYLSEIMGSYMLGILISIGIGIIIGLEREYNKLKQETGFSGIRTFPMVTILGFVIGSLGEFYTIWLSIASLVVFILFLGISQFSKSEKSDTNDLTTNLALITTFVLGLMVSEEMYREAVATSVIITTLLSLKTRFTIVISNITADELSAFIKFTFIALLILWHCPRQPIFIFCWIAANQLVQKFMHVGAALFQF